MAEPSLPADEELLGLQRAAFGYVLQEVNPANGLVADSSRENSPARIAVVGFALSAYPVAVDRGWRSELSMVEPARRSPAQARRSDRCRGAGWRGECSEEEAP